MHYPQLTWREEDYLSLSGIQHFAFCRRQWALIHLEGIWSENLRTVEGNLLHERAHDSSLDEKRGNLLIRRGMNISSAKLGISGQCDIVEFHLCEKGVALPEQAGLWQPYPVEYKRGSSKTMDGDRLQLCAQAICLEEMLCCSIPVGALFYGETRRREEVPFTDELRQTVYKCYKEMHEMILRGHTPVVRPSRSCNACSLRDDCMPQILHRQSVSEYMSKALQEELP